MLQLYPLMHLAFLFCEAETFCLWKFCPAFRYRFVRPGGRVNISVNFLAVIFTEKFTCERM